MALTNLIRDPNADPMEGVNPDLFKANAPMVKQGAQLDRLPNVPLSAPGGALPDLSRNATPAIGGLRPLVTSPRQQQEQQLQERIAAFNNPMAPKQGFWAKLGNVVGNATLGERNMSYIPGTSANKRYENEEAQKTLGDLEQEDTRERQQFSQETLQGAQTKEAEARAKALENPPEKPDQFSFQQTDHGLMRIDNVTGEATPVTFNGQVLQPKEAKEKEVGPKEDLQNQILTASEKGDTAQVKVLQDRLRAIDPVAADRLQITVRGQNLASENRQANVSRQDVREHDKAYVQPAESAEKSYQMADHAYQEYAAAKKAGKELPTGAQSMLMLSQHLQTTFGTVKGARVTKDMIQHHLGARSISDSAEVAINKLVNGDALSADQWGAFHDLIKQSRNLSWSTAVKEAARKKIPIDFLPPDLQTISKGGVNYNMGPDGQYHKEGSDGGQE